ncbi:MAG: HD domain-containing protein, partial [Bacteroidales bacterium]
METKNEKKQEQSTREYSDELKQELVKRAVERENDMRGDYFRDYTAIFHSRPFRRLKHKTQVFFDPKDDHICTRMEHVLQVASIAKTICMGLKKKNHDWNFLDEDLAYAIALGHDLGHAPFGHTGEKELNALLGRNEKFMHEINSYRVVSRIAGEHEHGLNLTYAVKDGIICHCGEKFEPEMAPTKEIKNLEKISDRENYPTTYEGCIVRFSDKIAYLGRDLEDTIAAGFFGEKGCNLPNDKITEKLRECLKEKVGKNKILKSELEQINRNVIDYFVKDIVKNSYKEDKIRLSTEAYETMKVLIEFCRIHIFVHPRIEEYKRYCKKSMKI